MKTNGMQIDEASKLVAAVVDSMEASAKVNFPNQPWPTVAGRLQGLLTVLVARNATPDIVALLKASIETPKA